MSSSLRYSTKMKYCCIWFRFCPPKSLIITHHVFSQSQLISASVGRFVARYKNNIVLFSHQFTHQVEFSSLIFFFNILTLNKRCLET